MANILKGVLEGPTIAKFEGGREIQLRKPGSFDATVIDEGHRKARRNLLVHIGDGELCGRAPVREWRSQRSRRSVGGLGTKAVVQSGSRKTPNRGVMERRRWPWDGRKLDTAAACCECDSEYESKAMPSNSFDFGGTGVVTWVGRWLGTVGG